MQKMKEYVGALKIEFQEIDKLYENEKAVAEIQSITGDCIQLCTIICC